MLIKEYVIIIIRQNQGIKYKNEGKSVYLNKKKILIFNLLHTKNLRYLLLKYIKNF